MKFFIDTADIEEIKQAIEWGMCDGVTTNPSLLAKQNKSFEHCVKEICELVDGPVSLECVSEDAENMLKEAEKLRTYGDNVVIKLPMCMESLKATRVLKREDVAVNMTLCFSPLQGLMAAKAGAAFISPFVGRLDDIAHDGMELISQLLDIYDNYDFETEVLAASIRHPGHVVECALLGADVATLPFSVLEKLSRHPLTDKGIEAFNTDWQKVKKDTE